MLIIIAMFAYIIFSTPHVLDTAVAQSFETYLELNGYNDI